MPEGSRARGIIFRGARCFFLPRGFQPSGGSRALLVPGSTLKQRIWANLIWKVMQILIPNFYSFRESRKVVVFLQKNKFYKRKEVYFWKFMSYQNILSVFQKDSTILKCRHSISAKWWNFTHSWFHSLKLELMEESVRKVFHRIKIRKFFFQAIISQNCTCQFS